jgi:hypothetical protein
MHPTKTKLLEYEVRPSTDRNEFLVVRGEDIGVFNQSDGLTLAGNPRIKKRIQVVNGRKVGGNHGVSIAKESAEGECGPGLAQFDAWGGDENSVQRNDARDDGELQADGMRGSLMLAMCMSPCY